jgi:hypothetical protein
MRSSLTIHLLIFTAFPVREEKVFSSPQQTGRERRKEVNMMSIFDNAEVISKYPLAQAIKDGIVVEICKNRWPDLSGGKPIVATAHLHNEISLAGLMEIWNEFVTWQKSVMPTLPEEERLFHTTMNGKTVWVIADNAAFTLMYPEDY